VNDFSEGQLWGIVIVIATIGSSGSIIRIVVFVIVIVIFIILVGFGFDKESLGGVQLPQRTPSHGHATNP